MNRSTAILSTVAVLGTAALVHATNARVESMGKHDTYFMDDISVWSNPANANLYPNYLFGELGQMRGLNGKVNSTKGFSDTSAGSAFVRYNQDPQAPWFGAVFAKSFNADPNSGNRYPQIVIGGALNREDPLLAYLPTQVLLTSSASKGAGTAVAKNVLAMQKPMIKADALLGFTTSNELMFGAKLYLAHSDTSSNDAANPVERSSTLWAGTFGVNMHVNDEIDFEASGTVAGIDADATSGSFSYRSESDLSLMGQARAFLSVPAISGQIVPAISIQQLDAPGLENELKLTAGSGVNVSMDRGFFWLGGDYTMESIERRQFNGVVSNWDSLPISKYDANSVRISFGIERNVWWDWFVLRVGGQKVFTSSEESLKKLGDSKAVTVTNISTNPEGNGTENDHVSFGFGLNIEDKLKVDAVVAEDILFTGGNLFSGPADHVLSRISATYSF
ncbi:MAG: hypothetical protein H6686_08775 [Fibrobacteria bacterium]|nr:hypothetical protein [Fibrobacteria bacterium]